MNQLNITCSLIKYLMSIFTSSNQKKNKEKLLVSSHIFFKQSNEAKKENILTDTK